MSSLDKLAIRGIRSFDDKNTQVIQFYSPVTLIVGANGTGKTTIIESLKYATTGELPPNTKGGAFVHDPKMAGEREVKAQVRLRFWNVKRERMVATRNLQVSTKKAGGLTMKTLEGVLSKAEADNDSGDKRDAKRNAISTKCAEMDIEIPHLMGVTTAILDNVIFCHQEEANWPLSEPAALKKKFDEIFEASKYTKAIDHIKSLRKERVSELKVDQERLSHFKSDKDKAERLTADLHAHQRTSSAKKVEAANLGEEVAELDKANNSFRDRSAQFNATFEKAENLQRDKANLQSAVDDLRANTALLKDSDQALTTKIKDFDVNLAELQHQEKEQAELQRALQQELEGHRAKSLAATTRLGERQGNRKTYDDNAKNREHIIHEIAARYALDGFEGSLSRQRVEEFMATLDRANQRSKAALEQAQAKAAETERERTKEVNDLTSKLSSTGAIRKGKEAEADKMLKKIAALENDSQSVQTFEMDMKNLERDIRDLEVKLAATKSESDELHFDDRMATLSTELRALANSREELGAELRSLESQSELRAGLHSKQESLKLKEDTVVATMDAHRGAFESLVGGELDAATMESKIAKAQQDKQSALEKAARDVTVATRKQQQITTQLDISKQQLQAKLSDASRKEKLVADTLKKIFEELDEAAVHQTAEEAASMAEEEVRQIESEIMMAESGTKIFDMIAKHEAEKHTCVGCDRAISATDRPAFLSYIRNKREGGTKRTQSVIAKHKADLATWQTLRSKALAVQPAQEEAKALRNIDIPDLQRQIKGFTAQLETADNDLSSKQTIVTRAQTAVNSFNPIKLAAAQLLRDTSEMEDLVEAIREMQDELKAGGHTRSSNNVHEELSKVSSKEKKLGVERQKMQTEKDQLATRLRNTEVQLGNKRRQESDAKVKAAARTQALKQLAELKEAEQAIRSEVEELAREVSAISPKLRLASESLRHQQTAWATEKRQLEIKSNAYVAEANRVSFLTGELQRYEDSGGDSSLTEAENNAKALRRVVAASEEKVKEALDAKQGIVTDIAQADNKRRQMEDNLTLRKKQTQIATLETEISNIDLDSAARARREFDIKYSDYVHKANDKRAKHQRMVGELAQMDEMEKRMQRQLKNEYKNIQEDYIDCLFKVKTGGMINTDLDKYSKALDNAIMRYHTLKMEEINQNIADLWRKTYQGTDIDTIRIRSDHDENSTSVRKTYNYRVVMVKDQVELDMRGRCSAGQKVLASIIIRLALADSMSINCGVLALDEPSTNLDQETVEGLASALADLIEDRRKNANFQLIIITHDESFLTRLSQAQLFNFYWRVSRNSEQKSIVSRERTTYSD